MKIAVIGMGYVGIANAVLLGQNHEVNIFDIDNEKLDILQKNISPIKDHEISEILHSGQVNLKICRSLESACENVDFVLIAIAANYNDEIDKIDTSSIDKLISDILALNNKCKIVVKSTVYVGFIDDMCAKYDTNQIYFSPEFLREGKAYIDCKNSKRIVIGYNEKNSCESFANTYVDMFAELCNGSPEKFIVQSSEAEAAKLFANSYLAMRVAYFNELDSYAEQFGLNSKNIIDIISSDQRIGRFYNNPSFGYGGYCLPKDAKQLSNEICKLSQEDSLINCIEKSNKQRYQFIAHQIINFTNNKCCKENPTIGIYKLAMKFGSDNFRNSSMFNVIKLLKDKNYKIIIFEDLLSNESLIFDCEICSDINEFKNTSDVIITNRYSNILDDVKDKIYTRDIFHYE